ncbi:hypothetical protein BDZ97DRAFT_120182 [Flammula alnicola]|nr:hypothetical protein BDZ97DRAFT_694376 [Flammula alnicola]KAF8957098.1 hypothetical protein BDZ97DRAFT_120182 [Flammula alnicola]
MRSTECGTVVHMQAAPHPRVGLWSACGAASSSVVPLEAIYFDTREAAKCVRSSCGCVKEGVGCAVCGNPLVIRYIPCKSASDGFFCVTTSRIQCACVDQCWQASSSHASDYTIFTFFSDTVTSSPSFEFPIQKPGACQQHYSNASYLSLDLSYMPPISSQGFLPDPSPQTTKATPS